ncbi:hypothetical protein LTR17_013970 [Elasticomyces elasticus]|nr:hypothetical protein LTR17_013970 [Elasticomyces elasticus]
MAAFGFSVGDFFSAATLILQATKALRASDTASAECQQAAVFLDGVRHALGRVTTLMLEDEDSQAYQHIFASAEACRKQVVDSLQRYKKYEARLINSEADDRSGWKKVDRLLAKNRMKLKWVFVSRDDLIQLRAAITPHLQLLQLSLQQAEIQKTSAIADQQCRMLAMSQATYDRVDVIFSRLDQDTVAGAERDEPSRPQSMVSREAKLLSEHTMVGGSHVGCSPPMSDMRELANRVVTSERVLTILALYLWQLYHFVRTMTNMPARPSFLLDSNIQIEDALGRSLSLPYEHFRYWPVLTARLEVAFDGCPGLLKVQRRRFAMFTIGGRGKALKNQFMDGSNWMESICRGDRFIMSMYVEGKGYGLDQCPRCGKSSEESGQIGWSSW